MRFLILTIVVILGAVYLGLEIEKYPGHVMIQIDDVKTINAPVGLSLGALLAGFIIFYIAVRLLSTAIRSPKIIRKHNSNRREKAAYNALNTGLLELSQGHWKQAQKRLSKAMKHKDTAALGCLGTARAAQELGNTKVRDKCLRLAENATVASDISAGITGAQLLVADRKPTQAAHQLQQLLRKDPKNTLILTELKDCYIKGEAWESLAELIPDLQEYKVLTPSEALKLARSTFTHVLGTASQAGDDTRALDDAWKLVPYEMRRDKEILSLYIRYLLENGEGTRPENILRNKIKQGWDDSLVYLYGLVDSGAPAPQLATAERWLKRRPDNAVLLLTLGRLALRHHLWSKARSYLEKSVDVEPRPETYMLLGKLLEQTGESVIAGECFREGLNITVRDNLRLERTPIDSTKSKKSKALSIASAPEALRPAT